MNYVNDLLSQLQKGVSMDDLAAQLTKALNDANNEFQKAEQEKHQMREQKIAAMREMFAAISKLMTCYGCEGLVDPEDTVELEILVDELDALIQEADEQGTLLRKPPFFGGSKKKDTDWYKEKNNERSVQFNDNYYSVKDQDPIRDFLDRYVR